jgi:23S rRNA (adenine-N6)-dimethyltransferase
MSRTEQFSQVFLKSERLAGELVDGSSITRSDSVLEVGPGTGVITDQLITRARDVTAIEKDLALANLLRGRYKNVPNVQVINGDILSYVLPDYPYKVFSNIPFAIEGELVRIFLNTPSPLMEAYLFMRREYAMRFAGIPRESQFHITYSPWFDLRIYRSLHKDDFRPKPRVETDILELTRREQPLVDKRHRHAYLRFVQQGYGNGSMVKHSLTPVPLSYVQLSRLAHNLGFRTTDKPSDLTLDQWVGMFNFFTTTSNDQQQRFLRTYMK